MTLALPSGETPGACPPLAFLLSLLGNAGLRNPPAVPHQQSPTVMLQMGRVQRGVVGGEIWPGPGLEIGSSMVISPCKLPQPHSETPLSSQALALQRVLVVPFPGLVADPWLQICSSAFLLFAPAHFGSPISAWWIVS